MSLDQHDGRDELDGLTVRQFADLFYVSDNTVRRWVRMGRIDSYKVSDHKTVIPRREVARKRGELGL